jgi:hypothetical protein
MGVFGLGGNRTILIGLALGKVGQSAGDRVWLFGRLQFSVGAAFERRSTVPGEHCTTKLQSPEQMAQNVFTVWELWKSRSRCGMRARGGVRAEVRPSRTA